LHHIIIEAPGRGQCVPDGEDGRFPSWRENDFKKRANVTEKSVSPLKRQEEPRLGRGNQVRKRQQPLTLDQENGNGGELSSSGGRAVLSCRSCRFRYVVAAGPHLKSSPKGGVKIVFDDGATRIYEIK